jgi:quinol monooxygenase YgiN
MVHVIASIRVREGSLDEYVALFKQNVPNVLAEDGCVQYAPCIDAQTGWQTQALDPQRMTVVEQWESMAALQAHARAPHMAAFRKKAGHLVEAMTLQVVEDA